MGNRSSSPGRAYRRGASPSQPDTSTHHPKWWILTMRTMPCACWLNSCVNQFPWIDPCDAIRYASKYGNYAGESTDEITSFIGDPGDLICLCRVSFCRKYS